MVKFSELIRVIVLAETPKSGRRAVEAWKELTAKNGRRLLK
jgi:hypothetical protein